MKRKLFLILTLFLVASCGSDDSGSTDPKLSLSASKIQPWEQETIELTARADSSLNVSADMTVSCSDGLLISGNLTLPQVDQDTSITCKAAATDETGNTYEESIDILVKAITLAISSDSAVPAEGALLTFNYVGPELTEDYEISFDGVTAPIKGFDNGYLMVVVPASIIGLTELSLSSGETSEAVSLSIDSGPVIDNPEQYLSDASEQMITSLNDSQLLLDDSFSEQLNGFDSELASMTVEEKRNLALFYQQNIEPLYSEATTVERHFVNGIQNRTIAECTAVMKKYVVQTAAIVASQELIVVSLLATTSIPNPFTAGALLLSTSAFILLSEAAVRNFEYISENCQDRVAADLLNELDLAQRLLIDESSHSRFVENETKVLSLNYTLGGFSVNETSSAYLGAVNSILEALEKVNSYLNLKVLTSISESLSQDIKTQLPDHSGFYISNISDSRINGEIVSASDISIEVRFSSNSRDVFNADGEFDFTFELTNSLDSEVISIDSKLNEIDWSDPVISFSGETSYERGKSVYLQVIAMDHDENKLSGEQIEWFYKGVQVDNGILATFNVGSQLGNFNGYITATDEKGNSSRQSFTITVEDTPDIPVASVSLKERYITNEIIYFTANIVDSNGGSVEFPSNQISWHYKGRQVGTGLSNLFSVEGEIGHFPLTVYLPGAPSGQEFSISVTDEALICRTCGFTEIPVDAGERVLDGWTLRELWAVPNGTDTSLSLAVTVDNQLAPREPTPTFEITFYDIRDEEILSLNSETDGDNFGASVRGVYNNNTVISKIAYYRFTWL